jgi:hypothetical protein
VDPGPIGSFVVRSPPQHYQRLEAVIRQEGLAFELFPIEIRVALAPDQNEAIALIDVRKVDRDLGGSFFDIDPAA